MAVIINGDTGIDKITDGSVVADDLASTLDLSGKTVTLPSGTAGAGKVLQVLQTVEQGTIVFTSTLADALTISVTPSSTSSKILVQWDTAWGRGVNDYGAFYLYRNGSLVSGAVSTAGTGNQINGTGAIMNRGSNSLDVYVTHANSGSYLDSPNTTSAITYTIKAKCTLGSNIYLNRPEATDDDSYRVSSISSLTVMEIAG